MRASGQGKRLSAAGAPNATTVRQTRRLVWWAPAEGRPGLAQGGVWVERAAGAVPPELPGGGAPGAPDLLVGATILVEDARVAVPTSRAGPSVTLVPAGTSPADAPPAASGRSPELERLRLYGGGLLVCLCLAMFGWIVWRGREPAPVTIRAAPAGSGAEIKVQVNGAVATPGVYRLLQGDRVEDAIRAAGGLAPDADPNRLNLAQRVRDEQRLDVPFLR